MTNPTPRAAVVTALVLMVAAAGCETPEPVVPPVVSVPTVKPTEGPAIEDPGVFVSKRFGLRLKLPHSATWKIDDTRNKWLYASQPTEGSTLLLRLWRDENRMTRDKCEERARSFRKLPAREGAEMVSSRTLDIPPGFDTQADVGLLPDAKGGLFGFILAFGGAGRKCFAYVYATRAEGAGADSVVADRLAEMMEGSLVKLTFESDLEAVLARDAEDLGPQR